MLLIFEQIYDNLIPPAEVLASIVWSYVRKIFFKVVNAISFGIPEPNRNFRQV